MSIATERVLVTGGSGFIGTHVVQALLDRNTPVLNLSTRTPMCAAHRDVHHAGDVSDLDTVTNVFGRFAPTSVIHLAARTEASSGVESGGFDINFRGAEILTRVLASTTNVRTALFASTMVVATPEHPQGNAYAQSKVRMEQVVADASPAMRCATCIVRPVSTWGPYFGTPFREFFEAVARRRYWHPGPMTAPKRFGYAGNTAHQLLRLLEADPALVNGGRFLLGDYELVTIERWAALISHSFRVRPPGTLPEALVRVAARAGDLLEASKLGRAPITTRRLKNMRADTGVCPVEDIRSIAGALPYTLDHGVEETVRWLRSAPNTRTPS